MQGNDLIRDRARTARPWEKSGGWTRRERLRVLWYRLRLTVREMNYATRRLFELQTGSAGLARQGPRPTSPEPPARTIFK